MFCQLCGTKITQENAKFCPECGTVIQDHYDAEPDFISDDTSAADISYFQKNSPAMSQSSSTVSGYMNGVCIALILIGLIGGIIAIVFMATEGDVFGYDGWDYEYAGGKELAITIMMISGISLLLGVCAKIFSSKKPD